MMSMNQTLFLFVVCLRIWIAQSSSWSPPKQDCVGSWSGFGACSISCDNGYQSKIYSITTAALNGGAACPHAHGEIETRTCNESSCPSNGYVRYDEYRGKMCRGTDWTATFEGRMSLSECMARCNAEESCAAFDTDEDFSCFLHQTNDPFPVPDASHVTCFIKQRNICCEAYTLSCQACAENMTEEEYCENFSESDLCHEETAAPSPYSTTSPGECPYFCTESWVGDSICDESDCMLCPHFHHGDMFDGGDCDYEDSMDGCKCAESSYVAGKYSHDGCAESPLVNDDSPWCSVDLNIPGSECELGWMYCTPETCQETCPYGYDLYADYSNVCVNEEWKYCAICHTNGLPWGSMDLCSELNTTTTNSPAGRRNVTMDLTFSGVNTDNFHQVIDPIKTVLSLFSNLSKDRIKLTLNSPARRRRLQTKFSTVEAAFEADSESAAIVLASDLGLIPTDDIMQQIGEELAGAQITWATISSVSAPEVTTSAPSKSPTPSYQLESSSSSLALFLTTLMVLSF